MSLLRNTQSEAHTIIRMKIQTIAMIMHSTQIL